MTRCAPYISLSLLCMLLYAPFCTKGLHIDSHITVYMAQRLRTDFVNPRIDNYGKILVSWMHTSLPDSSAFYVTPHPPLIPAYLVPFISLAGESEFVLNLAMFPFYLAAVLLFYGLAGIAGVKSRMMASVLFACCPAILVNAQNVMLDMPLCAFMMATLFFQFKSMRNRDAVFAGICAGLACLTKFSAGTLIFTALVYYLYERRYRHLALFALPFLLLNGAWLVHNLALWDTWQLLSTGHAQYTFGDIRYRGERLISYAGAAVIFPLFPLLLSLNSKTGRRILLYAMSAAALWSFLLVFKLGYTSMPAAFYALSAASGAILIANVFRLPPMRVEKSIYICIAVHVASQVVGGLFLTLYAVRYLLPIVFVLVIQFAYLADSIGPSRLKAFVWRSAIAVSLIISLMLSVSDWQYVESERQCARAVSRIYADRSICYIGRCGYLYYMNKEGFANLQQYQDNPTPGDIVVENVAWNELPAYVDMNKLELIDSLLYPVFPLRTSGHYAGFYGGDRLAYAWSPSDNHLVYRIYMHKP